MARSLHAIGDSALARVANDHSLGALPYERFAL